MATRHLCQNTRLSFVGLAVHQVSACINVSNSPWITPPEQRGPSGNVDCLAAAAAQPLRLGLRE